MNDVKDFLIHLGVLAFGSVKKIIVDLSGKVDKSNLSSIIYGTNATGNQSTIGYSKSNSGNTLAQRNGTGQLDVSAPTEDGQASNKKSTELAINGIFELDGTELTITKYPTE